MGVWKLLCGIKVYIDLQNRQETGVFTALWLQL